MPVGKPERDVLDHVDSAIAYACATEEYATQESTLRWLLELAWCDLQAARRVAANGTWSMACDHQVCRIIGLTKLVGPLTWEKIQIGLIIDGIYERIHAAAGTPTPLSDEDWRRVRAAQSSN